MKSAIICALLFLAAAATHAQNYLITFAGTGASTTVDSVKVENLSQCTTLILGGSDTLHLTGSTGIREADNSEAITFSISPNPMSGSCFIDFEMPGSAEATIGLFEINGKRLLQLQELFSAGQQSFILSGIRSGMYFMRISTGQKILTRKIICIASAQGHPELKHLENGPHYEAYNNAKSSEKKLNVKSGKSITPMLFNVGDTLKLTGRSGNFATVTMLIPVVNQTVTFTFVACTDADSNHYAVVQIGSQLWMAENLRATTYSDGSSITNVPDSATWRNTSSGAWCDYHNLPSEGAVYGHLYNFHAAADSRNICPVGWHVPSNSEWNVLERFLDVTDDTVTLGGRGHFIGRILKEGCDTRWQYLDTTSGLNAAGFSALCTNFRGSTGAWSLAPNNNHDCGFWTSTSYNTTAAWYRSLRWCFGDIYALFPFKNSGNSVRCIKD